MRNAWAAALSKHLLTELSSQEGQVIALAAATLASSMVAELAHRGRCSHQHLDYLISTLFQFEPDNTLDVYGGAGNLEPALTRLRSLLSAPGEEQNRETLRYLFGMMYLEKKLVADNNLTQVLHSRLQHAALQSNHFTDSIDATTASVAAVYQDTLSTLPHRIHVSGQAHHLQNEKVANQIRTLLLTGVRSIHLWRQLGGAKWRVVISRGRYLRSTEELIARAPNSIQSSD